MAVFKLHIKEMTSFGRVKKEFEVTLAHFKAWPDCGVPDTSSQFEGFSKVVELLLQSYQKAPIEKAIVHCKNGVGRTGTVVITLTRLLQHLRMEKE